MMNNNVEPCAACDFNVVYVTKYYYYKHKKKTSARTPANNRANCSTTTLAFHMQA